jgi:hypothetical protein
VISSDKPNDSTMLELLNQIKDDLKIIQTDYEHTYDVQDEIMEGKLTYDQVVRKHLEGEITEYSKKDILPRIMDDDFYDQLPHTLVLYEDSIGIFNHNNKYKKLYEMVFKNRHQRFTIIINVQEIYTTPPAIHKNLDTVWIFGGMSGKKSFVILLNQAFPAEAEKKNIIWENYKSLSSKQILLFIYDKIGTHVEIIK